MESLYNMELHDSLIIETKKATEGNPVKWIVTRVPGGWIYQRSNVMVTDQTTTFVPFSNEFMNKAPFEVPTKDTNTTVFKG